MDRRGEAGMLALVVLVTRLPFLAPGFGLQPDGWRVGLAARAMRSSGRYVASRYGANPLHELLAAALYDALPFALNLASALGAVALAVVIQLALRDRARALRWLAPLAVVGLPAVWVESVAAKDYLLAAALGTGAVVLASEDRPALSGVALGLAIGFRLPAGVLAPACALALPAPSTGRVLRGGAATALTGLLALSPSLSVHGIGILNSDVLFGFSWARLGRQLAQGIGLLGGIGLGLAALGCARGRLPGEPRARGLVRGSAWAVGVHVALYAWNPGSSIASYLVPSLPFAVIGASRLAPERWLRPAWILVAVSALVCGLSRPGPLRDTGAPALDLAIPLPRQVRLHPLFGRIVQDAFLRRREQQILEAAEARARSLPPDAVILAGSWRPKLEWVAPGLPLAYTLSATVAQRREVYAMPGAVAWNARLGRGLVEAAELAPPRGAAE